MRQDLFTRYALKIAVVQFVAYGLFMVASAAILDWFGVIDERINLYLIVLVAAGVAGLIGGYSAAADRLESELLIISRVLGANLVRQSVRHTKIELQRQGFDLPEYFEPDENEIYSNAIEGLESDLQHHGKFMVANVAFILGDWRHVLH